MNGFSLISCGMLSLKTDFNIPSDIIYFNASYTGPSPKAVTSFGALHLKVKERPWELNGANYYFDDSERLRQLFANLLKVTNNNIALVPSVSYGEETAVLNLPLTAKQNIIIPAGDFPSNLYPWFEQSKRVGCELRSIKRPWNYNWTEAVVSKIDEQTAVVCVPQCDWSDGTRLDLVTIGAACRQVGAALVIDISQSFGAAPFDIQSIDPDFVFCVGYKWLLGPYGVSYMYVADRHLTGRPLENNWINRKGSADFANLTDYQYEYLPGARRFDSGQHSQFILNPMACEALEYISKIGLQNIFEHCRFMNRKLATGLQNLGFAMAPEELRLGHLLGARPPSSINAKALREALQKENVYVSVRNNALRISPHLYNTAADVDEFLNRTELLVREKFLSFLETPADGASREHQI